MLWFILGLYTTGMLEFQKELKAGGFSLSFSITYVAREEGGSSVPPQVLLRPEVSDLNAWVYCNTCSAKGVQTMHLQAYTSSW